MRRHITIENKRILITIWQRTYIVQFTVYENDIMSLSETQQESYNYKKILSYKIKYLLLYFSFFRQVFLFTGLDV